MITEPLIQGQEVAITGVVVGWVAEQVEVTTFSDRKPRFMFTGRYTYQIRLQDGYTLSLPSYAFDLVQPL